MQDPSVGVPHQLQPHLACVSNFRYPTAQRLSLDNVFEYLLQAPQIVKQMQPMHWEYLNGPPDGTMHLSWLPASRQNVFASDGYVWNDGEQMFQQEVRGYTMEILMHRSGYRPGYEQVSLHQRHRYRLINKSNPAAAPPDPNLWLIHWSPCEPNMRFPINQVPISPQMQQQLRERQWIERQGQLVRKDFMLGDRQNWPTVSFAPGQQMPPAGAHPGAMYPQGPGPQIGMARPPYYPPQQAAIPQPPPKRARRDHGPPQTASGPPVHPGPPGPDPLILEEDTEFGDYLDNITPRELSLLRYKQHHEWMEEVFGSPYASGRIIPISLGLGLAGDLESITKGIFNAPSYDFNQPNKEDAPTRPYQKLTPEQSEEFEKRVAAFTTDGQAELEEMKREHAKLLAEIDSMKKYKQAERQLADTLSGQITGTSRADEETPPVDNIVSDIESSFSVKIRSAKDIYCREKGGFQEKKRDPTPPPAVPIQNGLKSPSAAQETAINGPSSTSFATPSGAPPTVSSAAPGATTSSVPETVPIQADSDAMDLQDEPGMDLLDVDGMDLDLDLPGLQDTPINSADDNKAVDSDWVLVNQDGANDAAGPASATAPNTNPTATASITATAANSTTTAPNPAVSAAAAESHSTPTTAAAAEATATKSTSTPSGTGAPSSNGGGIFDGTEFGSFDNLDTAGDALAEYGGADDLDLNLNDSAFGDAMMGTEDEGTGSN